MLLRIERPSCWKSLMGDVVLFVRVYMLFLPKWSCLGSAVRLGISTDPETGVTPDSSRITVFEKSESAAFLVLIGVFPSSRRHEESQNPQRRGMDELFRRLTCRN
jgi:hypothetical protein